MTIGAGPSLVGVAMEAIGVRFDGVPLGVAERGPVGVEEGGYGRR